MTYFEVKSPKRGAKLRLDASFFVIGRGERIPIFQDDPSISRDHAAVVVRKTGVRVRDLGSKNGVLLNGTLIGKYAEVDVKFGDTLKVGATSLVLREGEPPVALAPPPAEKPVVTQPTPALEIPPSGPLPSVPDPVGEMMTGAALPVLNAGSSEERALPSGSSEVKAPVEPELSEPELSETDGGEVTDLSKLEETEEAPLATSSDDDDEDDAEPAPPVLE